MGCWSNCGGQKGSKDHAKSCERACQPAWPSRAVCKTTAPQQAVGAHASCIAEAHTAAAQPTRGLNNTEEEEFSLEFSMEQMFCKVCEGTCMRGRMHACACACMHACMHGMAWHARRKLELVHGKMISDTKLIPELCLSLASVQAMHSPLRVVSAGVVTVCLMENRSWRA
eukprot:353082-Chlamydomonas_euryale.AAC.5